MKMVDKILDRWMLFFSWMSIVFGLGIIVFLGWVVVKLMQFWGVI